VSLKDKLLEDLKLAMKNRDVIKKNTIQMVRAAILQVEKDNKVTLNDNEVLDVIAKEAKKRKSTLPDFESSNRQDLIDTLKEEIEILNGYLPTQLTEAEIETIVKEAIVETKAESIKDMGKVMAEVMPKTKARADGKVVSIIVKKCLS
jgi:uncharacterized protein YqeY